MTDRQPPDAFSCGACSWFQATLINNTTGLAATGYCRRHAPAHNGFPAVFADGWCGDFTPGAEGEGEGAPEGAEVAVEAASDAATETTEAELRARIQELTKETEMLVKGMDVYSDHCAKLTEANTQHLARIAELEHEAGVMRDALENGDHRRIAQLEDALREMAKLAIDEIGARARVIKSAGPLFTGSIEKQKEAEESICENMEVVTQWLGINNVLKRCGLTLPTQEPTE
jgi:hypothetical protein